VGNGPIALTFSPDGKLLYTTSEGAAAAWKWPRACKQEGRPALVAPRGAELVDPEGAVVDVARARTDPANAVVAHVPAGCSAVRLAISPDGRRIYVTARNSNAVEVFDTAKLISDPDHSRLGTAPVGEAPVPVAEKEGADAGLGTILSGAFPRELSVSADGHTLFLTNAGSSSIQVIDVDHLPVEPARKP
jgi:hypothetical protein